MSKQKKQYTIGIDIGGTKMAAVLFDGEKVIADYVLATPKDTLEHFLVMLKALAEPLEEKARNDKIRVKGIGIGVAGVLDFSAEKMLRSPNISILDNVNIKEKIENFIGMSVAIDNDAQCFVRAEAMLGAGREYNSVYGVIIGTGIGGGWWINGKVHSGSHGGASEVDAIIIDLSSGLNIEESYQKLMQNNPNKVSQEAILGDPLADRIFSDFGRQIGVVLSNIANTIDPEIFVLGGGVMKSSDLFLSTAKKEMKRHINSTEAAKKIKVVKSKLGKNAGAIGAALLVA